MVVHIVIPTFRKLRQKECQKFKASLSYTVSARPSGIHHDTLDQKKEVAGR